MDTRTKSEVLYTRTYRRAHEAAIFHNGAHSLEVIAKNAEMYQHPEAYMNGYKATVRENDIELPLDAGEVEINLDA